MEMIDKELAIELLKKESNFDSELAVSIIEKMGEVDAEPVRHGKWKVKYGYNVYGGVLLTCSECGRELVVSPQALEDEHYCSYCGAKMDGFRE